MASVLNHDAVRAFFRQQWRGVSTHAAKSFAAPSAIAASSRPNDDSDKGSTARTRTPLLERAARAAEEMAQQRNVAQANDRDGKLRRITRRKSVSPFWERQAVRRDEDAPQTGPNTAFKALESPTFRWNEMKSLLNADKGHDPDVPPEQARAAHRRLSKDRHRAQRPTGLVYSLRALRRQVLPRQLFELHNEPQNADQVSPDTFAEVLDFAGEKCEYSLVDEIMQYMDQRGVETNENVALAKLSIALRRGKNDEAADLRAFMRRQGWESTLQLNWPRNLGSTPAQRSVNRPFGWSRAASPAYVVKSIVNAPDRQATALLIPAEGAQALTSRQITNLVDGLVIDGDVGRAWKLAFDWLECHKPSAPAATDSDAVLRYSEDDASYASTSVALMGILLKSMIASRESEEPLFSFIDGFIKRVSIPGSAARIRPGEHTLRQMIVGLERRINAFARSLALIRRFNAKYGMPLSITNGFTGAEPTQLIDSRMAATLLRHARADFRRAQRFADSARKRLESLSGQSEATKKERQVTSDHLAKFVRRQSDLRQSVSTWFRSLKQRDPSASDNAQRRRTDSGWTTRVMRELIDKAISDGVLDEQVNTHATSAEPEMDEQPEVAALKQAQM